jgi:poly-D-alanine transfer protein DltD
MEREIKLDEPTAIVYAVGFFYTQNSIRASYAQIRWMQMTKDMAFKLALDSLMDGGSEEWDMNKVRALQAHILEKHEKMQKGMNEFDSLSNKNVQTRMKNNLRHSTSKGMMDLMTLSCAEFMGEEYWLSLNNSAERDAVKRMYQRVRERLVG